MPLPDCRPAVPSPGQFAIVLVGVEFEENLSLRYLAGALLAAGYAATTIRLYNSILEAEAIADAIAAASPALVGISMAFQTRAIDDLTLVELLRQRGYRGHITAGGQFATLEYPDLFLDAPGLSSVVRFEAEATAVLLADTLRTGADLAAVPGLVWRDGATNTLRVNTAMPPPGDLNALAWPLRQPTRREYLGQKTAHMIGSRGCHATCKYCCVAALASERSAASRESGGGAVPGTRRRTAANVAAEMAYLYHELGCRIFEFQDDNWIPPRPETAVAYFTDLQQELTARGVGQVGLTLKTRADAVQPATIRALQAIGLIRVFVGIESGTQSLLNQLGRQTRVEDASLRALQVLRDHGVPAYFNALLFGPDIRFADIEPELTFLERGADFPFEIVEVVIYGKTGLYLSLQLEQRLHGNYLAYEYDYLDDATQVTHELVAALETRHFGVYSPVKMAADLGFNLGVLQVFYPGAATATLAGRVEALTRRINLDQVQVIRRAAALALAGVPLPEATETLRLQTVAADLGFYREIIELQLIAEQVATAFVPAPTAYYRTGALVQSGLIAGLFLLALGNAAGQTPKAEAAPLSIDLRLDSLKISWDKKKWRQLKRELRESPTPIYEYGNSSYQGEVPDPASFRENSKHLSRAFRRLSSKRQREDYDQLTHLLRAHNPKIRVAASLILYADKNGVITAVASPQRPLKGPATAFNTPGGLRNPRVFASRFQRKLQRRTKPITDLSPTLHDTILAVLARHRFHLREFGSPNTPITKPRSPVSRTIRSGLANSISGPYKLYRHLFPVPYRRGPMD